MIRMVTSSEHCASAILFLHSYNDDDEDDDDDDDDDDDGDQCASAILFLHSHDDHTGATSLPPCCDTILLQYL